MAVPLKWDAESDSDESMKGSAKPKGNPKSKGAKKPSRATNKKAKGKKDEKNKPAKKKSRASNKGDDQLFRYKSWRVVPDTWISSICFEVGHLHQTHQTLLKQ